MAVNSVVNLQVTFSGDVNGTENPYVAPSATSPAQLQPINLSSGANTISVPSVIPNGVFIWPPTLNNVSIIFKGVTGDTGVRLHNTNATFISLDPSVTSFVLTAASSISGVRLIWT